MGYYTYYNLDAYENGARVTEEREKEICTVAAEVIDYLTFDHFNAVSYDAMKWYDHDEDLLELSKRFPTVTFELSGEGEDRDDNWIAYYKNGEMEVVHGRIVYDAPCRDFAREVARF